MFKEVKLEKTLIISVPGGAVFFLVQILQLSAINRLFIVSHKKSKPQFIFFRLYPFNFIVNVTMIAVSENKFGIIQNPIWYTASIKYIGMKTTPQFNEPK